MSDTRLYDLAVIGGGINGVGIARDAAGRGLGVVLVEKADLGSATSSASTKLIHGGLRYLEHYEFRLVREALAEREVLLRAAPHIVWPLRFVLPHNKGLRPAWLIRLGLFLYDHLGGRDLLPGSARIDLRRHPAGAPLSAGSDVGFVYSDCWVQDSRLVVLNAIDAGERGADIRPRTECVRARREGQRWRLVLRDASGALGEIEARALVNAAGPWAGEVLEGCIGVDRPGSLRLIKGSHIVVPKIFDHDDAYIFQNADRRIVFAIPYETDFTLIGTTDAEFEGTLDAIQVSAAEIDYLCRAVSEYFAKPVVPADVIWSYAGVRPLYDDNAARASAVTRDYVLDLDDGDDGAPPLLNVFGGKLTTYRKLAEHALAKLAPTFGGIADPWTARAPLPGGDMVDADFERFFARFTTEYAWLPAPLARRLARAYGTRAADLLGEAASLADLGGDFGAGFTETEARYLMAHEFAACADDMLWRRSKMGLHCPPETAARLRQWIDAQAGTANAGRMVGTR